MREYGTKNAYGLITDDNVTRQSADMLQSWMDKICFTVIDVRGDGIHGFLNVRFQQKPNSDEVEGTLGHGRTHTGGRFLYPLVY